MATVNYYPNSSEYKTPLGAVEVGKEITLNLSFSRPANPAEVYLVLTKDGEDDVWYPMNFVTVDPDGLHRYRIELKVTSRGLYFYHFIIHTDTEEYRVGADESMNAMLGKGQDWQLTVFEQVYNAPEWLAGGVMYQIMPDRFNIGGERLKTKKRDVVYRDDWGAIPEYRPTEDGKILNNDFFGGNLKGITKKLGYLKSLGVNCIYLNPIFEAHSNHKYDTANYRKVDSDFGSIHDLDELIRKADKKGIKIILDGVFSHTGDDSIYFNKYGNYDSVGAYQSTESPYYDWYGFKNFPDEYDCWWNISILPNTKEENPAFNEYVNGEDGIIRFWTDLGIAGWRLDVADELPNGFLDRAVRAAKSVRPDALVLGEVWEDASNKVSYGLRRRYLQGGQLDSVTNYPFKEDIIAFVKSGDAGRLNNTVNVLVNNYPKRVLDCLMNILDTHDTVRILSVLGDSGDVSTKEARANAKVQNPDEAFELLKLATVLQYTLPGVPCVYYGDEAGLEGFEDPFNRRCYPWGNENRKILRWYKKLGKLRAAQKDILAHGAYLPIKADGGVLVFERAEGENKLTVIVNNGGEEFRPELENAAMTDLLTGKPFTGTVPARSAAVVKKTEPIQ